MDGARDLDQAIEQINQFADDLTLKRNKGWELNQVIRDDYGFLDPAPPVTDVNIKNKVSDAHTIYTLVMLLTCDVLCVCLDW